MRASWLSGFVLLLLSLPGAAEPIRVTGRVVAKAPQQALDGTRVELFRVDADAKAPLSSARTGADGSFEIVAPESGGFRLTVEKEGFLSMEIPFLPLVEDSELPVAALVRGALLAARTVGSDGRPLAGVETELSVTLRWEPEGVEESPSAWRPVRQRGISDKDGRLTFLTTSAVGVELKATSPPYRGQSVRWAAPFAPLILALSPRPMAAQPSIPARPLHLAGKVVDLATGMPVAGALVWSGWPLLAPVARTNPEGGFQMDVPAGQAPWLAAAAAGYLPGERQPARPGAANPLVLKLAPSAVLSGVVVDAAGQPVAGARLVADPPTVRASASGGSPRWATARSRADGGFRLTGLRPGGIYELTATREGFVRAKTTARAAAAGRPPVPVRIVLSAGITASGTVADEEGQPIAGAEVTLVAPVGQGDARATSDKEGRFELRHLEPGTCDLLVRARGYARLHRMDVEIPAGAPAVDLGRLTLDHDVAIEGRVTDTRGTPLAGAEVRLVTNDPAAEIWQRATGEIFEEQRTGPAGRFRAGGLQRGQRYQLMVVHPGHVDFWAPDVVAPTAEPLRIEMKTAHTLAGRVLGPEGEPVPGASLSEVRELRAGSSMTGSGRGLGQTDAEGRFRVTGLPAGLLTVDVLAESYGRRRVEGLQIPEEGDLEGVEIAFQRGAYFDVVVHDAEGAPLAGVDVHVMPASGVFLGIEGSCRTDSQGRCRLNVSRPGSYQVTASQDIRLASVDAMASPEGTSVELRLPAGFDVSGWVRAADGGGVEAASVQLESEHGGSTLQTGADGTFVFRGLPENTYVLRAQDRLGRTSDALEVSVKGQPVRNLELKLDRKAGSAISGRVLGLPSETLSGVMVTALPAEPRVGTHFDTSGRVGPDGRYRIEGIEPGDWKVGARTPNGRSVEATVHVEPGAAVATLDLQFPPGILSLSGRVLVDGAPLAGAEIGVTTQSSASLGGMRTGWDGSFAVRDLEPGTVTLQFFSPDGIVASRTFQLRESQEVLIDLTTGRLRGIILSASGEPVEEVTVTVEGVLANEGRPGEATFSAASLRSGSDGSFEAPRLVAGTYRISLQKEGFAATRATVEVPPAGEGTVEIRLTPKGGS
jgi:carboxypeptidase family protein